MPDPSSLLKDLTGIGAATTAVKDVLGMFFPDKSQEERDRMELALTILRGQLDANKAEAAHPSVLVAGWRPAVGWVCVAALGMSFIPKAFVLTLLWTWQAVVLVNAWNGAAPMPPLPPFPELGLTDLIGLLVSLLGVGVMRSVDKAVGKDTTVFAPREPREPPPP